jgi:tryptophan-rich sensory protein
MPAIAQTKIPKAGDAWPTSAGWWIPSNPKHEIRNSKQMQMTKNQIFKSRSIIGFFVILGITFSAAAIGGWASANAPGFYALLNKPIWAPPAAVFGPVWTVLYLLMALAAWLVWKEERKQDIRRALSFYSLQLALNALWTWVFFAWRLGGWALAEISVLWVLILLTSIGFYRVRPMAGLLLVPYLAWVTFATVLNAALWRMNPQLL